MTSQLDPKPPPGAVVHRVAPLQQPPLATIRPPGSKSATNRALMVAALARGRSRIEGALEADDTTAMIDCIRSLGARVERDGGTRTLVIDGIDGRPPPGPARCDARLSGTSARFVLASCSLGTGPYEVDGDAPLRARPMGGILEALGLLGAEVVHHHGHLPAVVRGGPVRGGHITVGGDVSSQYLSGLAMAGACMEEGLVIDIEGGLVSAPYVAMTLEVMEAFGAQAHLDEEVGRLRVAPGGYRGTVYTVEADASAASYLLAAAAVCGGRVRVVGVGASSSQGDTRFAEVLSQMGATVDWGPDWVEVAGPPTGQLHGVTVDLGAFSDTAPTLAAVAVFADSPTEVRGVGFIRGKESDRIAGVVTELQRLGITAHATPDGFVVHPGTPRPAAVRTYDDHRMAMAFTVIGLASPGVEIVDPGCVAKTYPEFFADVDRLRGGTGSGG